MIMACAASRLFQRRSTRNPPLLPTLLLLLLLHVFCPPAHSVSDGPLIHPPISSLLSSIFPPSPSPPSHIRVLYVGPCSQAVLPHHTAPSYLIPRLAIQCLSDDHPQIGHCRWFIHADDREAGKILYFDVFLFQTNSSRHRLHASKRLLHSNRNIFAIDADRGRVV